MSFMLSHAGTLYQKDLGLGTTYAAERVRSFNPDKGWEKTTPDKP